MSDCAYCDDEYPGTIVSVFRDKLGNPPEREGTPCWNCADGPWPKCDICEKEADRLHLVGDDVFCDGCIEPKERYEGWPTMERTP